MTSTVSRRSFLKVGLAGAAALAAAGGTWRLLHPATPTQPYALDGEAKAALVAIIPALLAGMLPPGPQALDGAVAGVQHAIAGLPLHAQKEIADLFGLLALSPARRLLAGVSEPWATAKREDVAAFLQAWRTHRLAMLQTAYHALHDLVFGGWYGNAANWAAIGYPGPIKELT